MAVFVVLRRYEMGYLEGGRGERIIADVFSYLDSMFGAC